VYSTVTTSNAICWYYCWKVSPPRSTSALSPASMPLPPITASSTFQHLSPTTTCAVHQPSLLITTEDLSVALSIWFTHIDILSSPPPFHVSPPLDTHHRSAACGSRNNHSIKSNRLHRPPPHQRTIASHSRIQSPYHTTSFITASFSSLSPHHTTAVAAISATTAR
jgi:hypothetical protein